jgi:hypothetical protein
MSVLWPKGRLPLVLTCLLVLAVGCSGPISFLEPPSTPTPEVPRAELAVMAFLRTWERGEFNTLFDYLSSASRASIGREEMVQLFRQAYQDASISSGTFEIRSVLQKDTEAQVAFHQTMSCQ